MNNQQSNPFFDSILRARTQIVGEPDWLSSFRSEARLLVEQQGFPTRDWEEFKYFNFDFVSQGPWLPLGERSSAVAAGSTDLDLDFVQAQVIARALPFIGDDYSLIFVNGRFVGTNGSLPSGLRAGSFSKLVADDPSDAYRLFNKVFKHDPSQAKPPFASINQSLFLDAGYVTVAPHTNLSRPVNLINVTTSEHPNAITAPTCLIDLGEGTKSQIREIYLSASDVIRDSVSSAACSISQSRIFLDPGAYCEYTRAHVENSHQIGFGRILAELKEDSILKALMLSTGSTATRLDFDAHLSGPRAEIELNGLFYADQTQTTDFHTRIDHAVPDCKSRETIKGILSGSSRGIFNGLIRVAPEAQRTDSRLLNKNLLLSTKAEMDTKPELQVHADDVKASHGATVGQLQADELFYLESRAIDPTTAIALITDGFARDLILRLSDSGLQSWLTQRLFERLKSGSGAGAQL